MVFSVRRVLIASLCTVAAATSLGVGAQQVYRIVGPDGRVTFSDRPPADARAALAPGVATTGGGSGTAALPFELRSVASRYPVTLYTGTDCAPCASGRAFLGSRGIPFAERTVTTGEDIEALKRLAGAPRLPFLTIGGQQIHGFSEPEWSQFLDAAGYPRTSRLPNGFRNPPPAPLVAVQQPVPAAGAPEQPQRPQQAQVPPPPAGDNPAGIRF